MLCYICQSCGSVDQPTTKTSGSIAIELVLWCCFIIPGLIYSIWRHTSKKRACKNCGGQILIPTDTPAGAELVKKYNISDEQIKNGSIKYGASAVKLIAISTITVLFVYQCQNTIKHTDIEHQKTINTPTADDISTEQKNKNSTTTYNQCIANGLNKAFKEKNPNPPNMISSQVENKCRASASTFD